MRQRFAAGGVRPASAHHEDGARRLARDSLHDRFEDPVLEFLPPMGTHDDDVVATSSAKWTISDAAADQGRRFKSGARSEVLALPEVHR